MLKTNEYYINKPFQLKFTA